MKKRPIARAVELTINWQNGATLARADGILRDSGKGVIFLGLDENDATVRLTLPGKLPRVGRPKLAARENMFRILRNLIAQRSHRAGPTLAEVLAGRSSSSLDRALHTARHFIRKTAVCKMDDGRILAIAWMHDGQQRGNAASGPAWFLFDGDIEARFASDLTLQNMTMERQK